MNILGIVPARGGSKGISLKNLAACAGKSLVCWTLDAIQDSKLVNYAVLSSDDKDILAWAGGGKMLAQRRPVELAEDWTPTESVISYILDGLEPVPDIIVLLQPTSPVRTGKQIDEAVRMVLGFRLGGGGYDSVLSVVPSHAFLWWQHKPQAPWASYDYQRRQRRQDLPPQFEENGSIYVFTKSLWDSTHNRLGGEIGLYVMGEESRCQIDSSLDLAINDFLLRKLGYATPSEGHRA